MHKVSIEKFKSIFLLKGNNYPGVMVPGMTFTIEPALAQGSGEVEILEDGWSVATVDNGRSAQCEHTILITETGCEILT